MNKKLTWFYRLSIWMILILFSVNILVKTIIWSSASLSHLGQNKNLSLIVAFDSTPRVKYRYTTKQKQRFFKAIDYLLTPAFSMLFILIVVKLIKTPEIFKEND